MIKKVFFLVSDLSDIQQLLLASFILLFNGNACKIRFCCNLFGYYCYDDITDASTCMYHKKIQLHHPLKDFIFYKSFIDDNLTPRLTPAPTKRSRHFTIG